MSCKTKCCIGICQWMDSYNTTVHTKSIYWIVSEQFVLQRTGHHRSLLSNC
jgi:hypothetical protein